MKSLMKPGTLLCFSPPIMLATIIIELGLALMIAVRYTLRSNRRLIVLILICLGGFQLAEFNVCGGAQSLIWSRLGYSLITLLPALGIHLAIGLMNRRTPLVWAGYASAIFFIAAFAFLPSSLNGSVCTGNYVIFHLTQPLGSVWAYYYMVMVFIGLAITTRAAVLAKPHTLQSSAWLAIGYLSFTVPTYVVYYLVPSTGHGLPSIMCGFAVVLALILGFKVAPQANN